MTRTLVGPSPAVAAVAAPAVRAGSAAAPPARLPLYVERDRFIAVPRHTLISALSAPELWADASPDEVATCFSRMAQWRHLSYAQREREVIDNYLAFNPDRESKSAGIEPDAYDGPLKERFLASVRWLLERANFDEIPRENLQEIIDEANPYGLELDVDLVEYNDILVSIRGEYTEIIKPDWVNWLLGRKPIKGVVFERVFVLFTLRHIEDRVKDLMINERVGEARARKMMSQRRRMMPPDIEDTHIYVKIFKNVPRSDLEIMFPSTRVLLRTSDKMTIGASAGSGIGMGVVSLVSKAVMAALSPLGVLFAVFGLVGAASQQVGQVVSRRARYMLKMTRHLHFQNISSNQGALALLIERAEEEDIKEEVLLYALLAKASIKHSELPEAKAAIESYLAEHFDAHVHFDSEDALGRLIASGLVVEDADGTLTALAPAAASQHLAKLWQGYLQSPPGGGEGTMI